MRKLKRERIDTTIKDAIRNSQQLIEDLMTEMEDWLDHLSGTPLENTSKYEMIEEAISELADIAVSLEDFYIPDTIANQRISYIWAHPYGKRISRAYRASQASSALQAVAETIREQLDDENTTIDTQTREDLYQVADDAEKCADDIDQIEFPSMY